jgi:MFS family permease
MPTTALSQKDIQWNIWTLGTDIAFFTIALSVSSFYTIMPLLVSQLGGSNWVVSMILTLRMVGISMTPLLLAGFVEKLRRVKPTIIFITIFERLPYLVLAIVIVAFPTGQNILILITFFAMLMLMSVSSGLCTTPWLDLISRTIPDRLRSRFIGWWSGIGTLFGIGGAALGSYLLQTVAWPWNYAWCFIISFIAVTISFILLAMGREPARTDFHQAPSMAGKMHEKTIHWINDMGQIISQDQFFRQFLIVNALAGSATIGSGLFAIVALRQAHLTDLEVASLTIILLIAQSIGSFLGGFIGDRFGHRTTLIWSTIAGTLATAITLIASNMILISIVFFLFGLGISGFGLAQMTFVIDFGPPSRRPVYIGIAQTLLAPFTSLAPLFGGIIADQWGYTPVFIIGTLLGVVASFAYWYYVKDPQSLTDQSKTTREHNEKKESLPVIQGVCE